MEGMPVVIERRFNGPPGSGHGGWSAGRAAALVDAPGGRGHAAAAAAARDAARGRARRRRGRRAARRRAAGPRRAGPRPWRSTGRRPSDLDDRRARRRRGSRGSTITRSRPASAAGRSAPRATRCASSAARSATAAARSPGRRRSGRATAAVAPGFLWAALDCPSSAPVHGTISAPVVLGRFTVALERPVRVGAPHVIQSWLERLRRPQAAHRGGAVRRRRGAAGVRARRLDRARPAAGRMSVEVSRVAGTDPVARRVRRRRWWTRSASSTSRACRPGRPRTRPSSRRRAAASSCCARTGARWPAAASSDSTTQACEIKRMYVVAGRARARARRGCCSSALEDARARSRLRDRPARHGRQPAGARWRSTRARATCRSPTTTATRTRRTGARSALTAGVTARALRRRPGASGGRRAPSPPPRRRRGRAASSRCDRRAARCSARAPPDPGEPAARQAAIAAAQVRRAPSPPYSVAVATRSFAAPRSSTRSEAGSTSSATVQRGRRPPSRGRTRVISGSPCRPSQSRASRTRSPARRASGSAASRPSDASSRSSAPRPSTPRSASAVARAAAAERPAPGPLLRALERHEAARQPAGRGQRRALLAQGHDELDAVDPERGHEQAVAGERGDQGRRQRPQPGRDDDAVERAGRRLGAVAVTTSTAAARPASARCSRAAAATVRLELARS